MIETRENIREMKMNINNEMDQLIELIRLSDREEAYSHFDNIMYYIEKLIQDRQEMNSELLDIINHITEVNSCLSSYNLCYYKDDNKLNWN